jgi:transposase
MSQKQVSRMSQQGVEYRLAEPEVTAKAQRRRFPSEYKVRILTEADGCTEPGEIGALLRREGLYDSHLTRWRQARQAGRLGGKGKPPKGESMASLRQEVAQLRTEKARLHQELQQAELIIDVQKKLSQLLGLSKRASNGSS